MIIHVLYLLKNRFYKTDVRDLIKLQYSFMMADLKQNQLIGSLYHVLTNIKKSIFVGIILFDDEKNKFNALSSLQVAYILLLAKMKPYES